MPVVEEENVGNTLAEVECKAVLETLAAIETDVKVHTLGDTLPELKVMQRLHALNDTVAENDGVSLGDTQVEINAKALDYEMTNKEEEVKLEIFGDTSNGEKNALVNTPADRLAETKVQKLGKTEGGQTTKKRSLS